MLSICDMSLGPGTSFFEVFREEHLCEGKLFLKSLLLHSNRLTVWDISTELTMLSLFSRDERRWIEKQNRAARALRKKEEMNRIRTLVGKHTNCCFF